MGNEEFELISRKAVADWYSQNREKITIDNVYLVWVCKALQNNKALLATTKPDGMYFEVTYNGDKNEMYLDAYSKVENVLIPIKEDNHEN
nr:MAG TPA: hypothetical protein [Caudoviricetes sp.]